MKLTTLLAAFYIAFTAQVGAAESIVVKQNLLSVLVPTQPYKLPAEGYFEVRWANERVLVDVEKTRFMNDGNIWVFTMSPANTVDLGKTDIHGTTVQIEPSKDIPFSAEYYAGTTPEKNPKRMADAQVFGLEYLSPQGIDSTTKLYQFCAQPGIRDEKQQFLIAQAMLKDALAAPAPHIEPKDFVITVLIDGKPVRIDVPKEAITPHTDLIAQIPTGNVTGTKLQKLASHLYLPKTVYAFDLWKVIAAKTPIKLIELKAANNFTVCANQPGILFAVVNATCTTSKIATVPASRYKRDVGPEPIFGFQTISIISQ